MEPQVKPISIPKEYEILLSSNSLLLSHRDEILIKVGDHRPKSVADYDDGMVWYSSIYIVLLNSRGPTEALLVRLASRKETSFKK